MVPDTAVHQATLFPMSAAQWGWEPGFLPALPAWLAALRWQPLDGQVTFLEMAFYFEASGYSLPGIPGAKYMVISLSFQERARVLRPALVNTQRHAAVGSLFPGQFVARASSLTPLGAGCHMGLSARPYFSSPGSMVRQLEAL